jgi:hypothetical protein
MSDADDADFHWKLLLLLIEVSINFFAKCCECASQDAPSRCLTLSMAMQIQF